jgi:hypothetical protein
MLVDTYQKSDGAAASENPQLSLPLAERMESEAEGPLKTCFKCGVPQPLKAFYKHPKMGDGHLGKCITCTKKDVSDREHRKRQTDPAWTEREKERCRGVEMTPFDFHCFIGDTLTFLNAQNSNNE